MIERVARGDSCIIAAILWGSGIQMTKNVMKISITGSRTDVNQRHLTLNQPFLDDFCELERPNPSEN